jgi:hypothetical protein
MYNQRARTQLPAPMHISGINTARRRRPPAAVDRPPLMHNQRARTHPSAPMHIGGISAARDVHTWPIRRGEVLDKGEVITRA